MGSILPGPNGRPHENGVSLLRRLAVSVLLLAPAAAAAEPMKLGASDIKQTFTGTRVELDTPLGTKIPVQFTGDGLMTGQAGSLASVLGAAKDRGRWWVKGDRLCTKWFRWFDAEEQCLVIHVKDERVFWRRDDGKKGTATIVERPTIVAQPRIPDVAAKTTVIRTASLAPVLKSPPRLAVRPAVPAEELGLPEEAPANRSLFFVGLGLARALQSELSIASAVAAPLPRPAPQAAKPKSPAPAKSLKTAAESAKPLPAPVRSPAATSGAERTGPTAPKSTYASFSVYGVDSNDVLNVRSGPSEYHAVVGAIPPAASNVRLVGVCQALWCEVQFRNARGWVNRYYLIQN